MALIQCRQCGVTVSDAATNCPNCNAPIRTASPAPSAAPSPAQPALRQRSACLLWGLALGGGCLLLVIIIFVIGGISGYNTYRTGTATSGTASTSNETPKEAPVPPQLRRYIETLGAIYTSLSTRKREDFRPLPCDGAALTKAAGKDSLILNIVYGPFLERFTTLDEPWTDDKSPWRFLSDSAFRGHFETGPKQRTADSLADTARRVDDTFLPPHFLIVIWPDDEEHNFLPQLTREKVFIGGEFHGWMVIANQTNGRIACMQRLDVTSSSEVSHRTRGLFGKDAATAVKDDFERNFQKAIERSLPDRVTAIMGFGSVFH